MADPIADPPKADPPKTDPAPAPKADPPKADPKADPSGDPPKDKTFTQADLDRALEKQKKDHDKAVAAEAAKAKLSDDEKKDATIKELQQSIRMRDAKDDVVEALKKEGAKATDLMWKAIKGELEFDEKSGKVSNLKDLIKDLKADFADQFGDPKPEGTIDGGAGQGGKGAGLTKEKLAAMTPAEVNALDWEEVKKVLAAK